MIPTPPPGRRTALAILAGLVGSTLGSDAIGAPSGATAFSSVGVDVGPLRAKGLGAYADAVGTALGRELAAAFADRMERAGPKLVIRIDGVSLRPYAGRDGRIGSGGTQSDYLEGEALVVGRNGTVLARHPQLSALPSSSGGAWYLPDVDERRLAALCNHYAGWLRRDVP